VVGRNIFIRLIPTGTLGPNYEITEWHVEIISSKQPRSMIVLLSNNYDYSKWIKYVIHFSFLLVYCWMK